MTAATATAEGKRRKSLKATTMMDVLRKTAQVITANFGIDVVFSGSRAYTDGKTIVVPSLPEDAPDDLVEAIIGFVDHEAGHILFTDFNEKRPFKDLDKRVLPFTNGIEDIRQEWLMGQEYRGAGLNLERTETWTLKRLEKHWGACDDLFKVIALCMCKAKEMQGHPYAGTFYDAHAGHYGPLVDRLLPRIKGWHALPSTSAAYDEAKACLEELDKIAKLPEPKDQQQQPQRGQGQPGGKGEGGDGDKGQKGDSDDQSKPNSGDRGNGEDEGRGEGGSPSTKEGQDEGDDSGQGEKDEGEDGDGQAPGGDGEEKDGDSAGRGASGDQAGAEDGGTQTQAGSGDGESERDSGDEGDESSDLTKEAHRIARSIASNKNPQQDSLHEKTVEFFAHDTSRLKGHRAYSTEFDRSVEPIGKGTMEAYGKVYDQVRPHVNVLYTVLTRTLLAVTRARTIYGRHEGKLNTAALARLQTGQTTVFKRRRKGKDIDTYVEIIVDHSGSMMGSKIHLAQMTCIALCEALERLRGSGVRYGISGFTAGLSDVGLRNDPNKMRRFHEFGRKLHSDRDAETCHRIDPIIEYVYKTPDEPLVTAKPKLSLMTEQWKGNNADGDSIFRIAKRVMQRKEARKVLIVLSDGWPNAAQGRRVRGDAASQYMRHVADMIRQTPGLEVIGIGIKSEAVEYYYERRVVVNKIDDLPVVAMKELSEALMGRGLERKEALKEEAA